MAALAALVAAGTAVAPGVAHGGGPATVRPAPAGAVPAAGDAVLSDERTLTRWAYPTRRALVRGGPRLGARVVGRLHEVTEEGFPEIYLLLAQRRNSSGRTWVRLRIPGRPNGRTGWVPRDALSPYHLVRTFLLIDRPRLRLTLYRSGRPIFGAPVGVGAPTTPTPAGRYWIREKFKAVGAPVYGPRAMGTAAYAPGLSDWPNGGVVGLHGTDRPELIPGRPSHGCIRLHNADVLRLYRLLPRGTPVRIR